MNKTVSLVKNIHITRRNPVSLIHFVTNRCNARCSFCFIDFDNPTTFKGELTVDEIDRMSRTFGPNLQNINLTGGEPFARKELLEIAQCYFRNTNIRSMFITSNGSLTDRMVEFSENMCKRFSDRKVFFSLSIDSFPEEHNSIRKIKNLFEKTMASYEALRKLGSSINVNIAITVSHENYTRVGELYDALIEDYGVRSITATIVRDEGVYRIPQADKRLILEAYELITNNIARDLESGRLEGYDTQLLQGRLMNKKNVLVNRVIRDIYMEPRYVSPCHAGALFGVIGANGIVSPCEILDDRDFGNLRDFEMNFSKLWNSQIAKDTKKWIRKSHCHCSYECAWSFNILGNLRYQPSLISAALGKYW